MLRHDRAMPGPAPLYDAEAIARWRQAIRLAMALLCGAAAVAAAVALSGLATRYLAAIVVAMAGLIGLPLLGRRQRASDVAVLALCLGLSVGFSISFLHRVMVPGKFVPFMGGAEAVTVSLSFVATALYYGLWAFERYFYGVVRPVRVYGPLFWPAVLFMAAGVLSLANAADLPLAALEEFRLLCLLAVTVAVMNFRPREVNIYVMVLPGSVMLEAALASMQFVTGRDLGLAIFGEAAPELTDVDFQIVARPTGLFGDPNIMAYFFEISLPLMLALAFVARGRLERLLYLAATLAGLVGIFISLSRAAWATAPVTLGFITLKLYGRRLFSLRAALVGIALLIAGAVAFVYIFPLLEHRLLGDDAGSMSRRLPLDVAALGVLRQFPWFGVGLNNFAITFTTYDTTGYSYVRWDVDYVVHNLFLLVWTEVGTIGFVAFLWYFGSVFVAASRLPREDTRARAIALGIGAGLFAHLMHGMVDPGFKLNLTISELIAAQIGLVGCLCLAARVGRADRPAAQVAARLAQGAAG
jgi:O-antigen ligase